LTPAAPPDSAALGPSGSGVPVAPSMPIKPAQPLWSLVHARCSGASSTLVAPPVAGALCCIIFQDLGRRPVLCVYVNMPELCELCGVKQAPSDPSGRVRLHSLA